MLNSPAGLVLPLCGVSSLLDEHGIERGSQEEADQVNSLDYQQLAHEAEGRAWAATSDALRMCWLDLAQAWLDMAQISGPPATQDVAPGHSRPALNPQ